MITYYVHIDPLDPGNPRLMRQINNANVGPPTPNPNANTSASASRQFRLTYDLADGDNNSDRRRA